MYNFDVAPALGNGKSPHGVMTYTYIESIHGAPSLRCTYSYTVHIRNTNKKRTILVGQINLSLSLTLSLSSLSVGSTDRRRPRWCTERVTHVSECHRTTIACMCPKEMCCVMFEYPIHNFDMAHASQTENALHRGSQYA